MPHVSFLCKKISIRFFPQITENGAQKKVSFTPVQRGSACSAGKRLSTESGLARRMTQMDAEAEKKNGSSGFIPGL